MDDQMIISLLKEGNIKGLEELIAKYRRLSVSIACTVIGSVHKEDVLECVNDTFYDIWQSFGRYDEGRVSLKSWVAMITRRRAVDKVRSLSRQKMILLEEFTDEMLAYQPGPEEIVTYREEVRQFNQFILNELSEMDRTIFIRRYFLLESIQSIADRFQLNRSVIDNRLSRMRKSLAGYLEGSEISHG